MEGDLEGVTGNEGGLERGPPKGDIEGIGGGPRGEIGGRLVANSKGVFKGVFNSSSRTWKVQVRFGPGLVQFTAQF